MAFGINPETNPQYKFYELLYTEAFQRLGYNFDYVLCPLKRCSFMGNSGYVDGEPQRAPNYSTQYSNMIRVNEPIYLIRVIAYSLTPQQILKAGIA